MKHKSDPEAVLRALKPAPLDRLAEGGYSRRRDSDVARITATAMRTSRARRRSPVALGLVAGATAAFVAAGAVVALRTTNDERGPETSRPAVAAPPAADARSFLLASARTAERAAAKTGEFWYQRERTTDRITMYPNPKASFRPRFMNKADKKIAIEKNFIHLSSPGSFASTRESWIGRRRGARTIIGIDAKVNLSPTDDVAWKKLGSPRLNPGIPLKPLVTDYSERFRLQIGNRQVSMGELAELPTDVDRLEADLRRRYRADRADPYEKAALKKLHEQPPTFGDVVWATARDLLAGPITPGTRAALYRLLAKQPGVELAGEAIDSLGRHGIAVTTIPREPNKYRRKPGMPQIQRRLIIDPRTAQLLSYEDRDLDANGKVTGQPITSVAYQAMGWTDKTGTRP